jgi:hypothetical protein
MKKILVALALAAFASTGSALVENSKHDFNFSGTYKLGVDGKASRCSYCHVPHNAATWAETGLWATQAGPAVTLFSGITSIDAARSQTCLACHADAASPPLDLAGNAVLGAPVADSAIVETDLTNDHPIGLETLITPGTNGMKNPTGGLKIGRATMDPATPSTLRTVECSLCHSVHGLSNYTIQGRKLLYGPGPSVDPAGWPVDTDFCNICHTR